MPVRRWGGMGMYRSVVSTNAMGIHRYGCIGVLWEGEGKKKKQNHRRWRGVIGQWWEFCERFY